MRSPVSRLTLRIYLVALTPILAILGVLLVLSTLRPALMPPRFEIDLAQRVAKSIVSIDSVNLEQELREVHASATVYVGDEMRGTNVEPPLPPLPESERPRLASEPQVIGPGIPSLIAVRLEQPNAYLQFRMGGHPPGPPGRGRWSPSDPVVWGVLVALLATAIAAVVLARSLTRPLSSLASVATAFGDGDLSARAKLSRKDELGELGRAFDQMADRVAGLMRSQQELLANVSHELRTPLARIRVALDIAAEGDAASARESLSEITEDLAELEQIVSEVLTTARLDLAAGRAGSGLRVTGELLDLGAILDKSAARFHGSTPERALERVTEVLAEGGGVFVKGDAVLLRRAFDNLLDNARAYSDPSMPVSLVASRHEGSPDQVKVAVTDRGIGIVAEDLAHLATPFFRTDRSRSRRSGGLGLGLSLTRRIVEAHGGALVIESVVGKGTTVTITLPVAPLVPLESV
jgi:two-component system OmpR family sensor kinase